jgi:para-nitrobenzyl esterase
MTDTKLSFAMRRLVIGLGLVQVIGATAHTQPADRGPARPIVQTAEGPVQGVVENGVSEFLGIPYAAPPIGPFRWRPPQPSSPWSRTLDASKFGNTCPQITEMGVFAGPVSLTEDCLSLNVFTTAAGTAAKGKPVLVWIHGGGFFDGESKDYDPSAIVKGGPAGPTVVVTINYRLGILGYLAHPALDRAAHRSGNYGLLDQLAALRWVQRNIGAFGGDPGNVTIGGQSAGATSAAAVLISPDSVGLIHRAIFQSGFLLAVAPVVAAEKHGTEFSVAAGCGATAKPTVASCLRAVPVERILSLQGSATENGSYSSGLTVDGVTLPRSGTLAWKSGQFAHIPIMNGITAEEGKFHASIEELFSGPLSAKRYEEFVRRTFSGYKSPNVPKYPPETADAALTQYPVDAYASPALAMSAFISDMWVCPEPHLNQLMAQYAPVYAYEFSYRSAPWYFPPQSFTTGAAHTSDIQFFFLNWHGGPLGIPHALDAQQLVLSKKLVTAWTNFMYTGDPNAPHEESWPRFTRSSELYLSWDLPAPSVITGDAFAAAHKCAFWDKVMAN